MSRTVVIANPTAGAGRVARDRESIRRTITEAIGDVEYVETTRPGEARSLAHDAVDGGAGRVLSLGGDGTHHEVVNGLMEHPDGAGVAFGVLPAGTGSDFRRTLGVATLGEALRALRERGTRAVDVGHAEYTCDDESTAARWFINLASCGVTGLVDRLVNASGKRFGGGVSFAVGTVQGMLRYDPARVRITADGRDLGVHSVSFVVVGNGRYAGGGMRFCPDALLDDGALDLVVMPHLGLTHALTHAHHLYRGTHGRVPGALIAKVAEVTVEVIEHTAWLDLDGEAPGRAPVTFTVQPGRLRLAGAP